MKNYNSNKIGIELKVQLNANYDILKISRWAYRIVYRYKRELSHDLIDLLEDLGRMEDDPQFEYSEIVLEIIAEKLINDEYEKSRMF